MARWDPPVSVENNEHVGRRLFDEPMLAGASDQPRYAGLLLTNFEENRSDEYSLDRLGKSSIDSRVVAYLKPKAEVAGRTFRKPKSFGGWAVLPARELVNARKRPNLTVIASPINDEEPNDNKYHAHVCRPQNLEPYFMALHLRHLFQTYGTLKSVCDDSRLRSWFSRLFDSALRPQSTFQRSWSMIWSSRRCCPPDRINDDRFHARGRAPAPPGSGTVIEGCGEFELYSGARCLFPHPPSPRLIPPPQIATASPAPRDRARRSAPAPPCAPHRAIAAATRSPFRKDRSRSRSRR